MTKQHSPAPWTAAGDRVSASNGDPVCDLLPPFPNDGDVFAANQCLIVAAPDLLAALKEAEMHLGVVALPTLRNLIDKAEGR